MSAKLKKPKGLSKREEEVLKLTIQGCQQKEIARLLHLELTTVKTYCRSARLKTGDTLTRTAARRQAGLPTDLLAPNALNDLLPKGGDAQGRVSSVDAHLQSSTTGDTPSDTLSSNSPLNDFENSATSERWAPADDAHPATASRWSEFKSGVKGLHPFQWLGLIPLTSILFALAFGTLLFLSTTMLESLNKFVR